MDQFQLLSECGVFRVIDSVAKTENLHSESNANVLGDWM